MIKVIKVGSDTCGSCGKMSHYDEKVVREKGWEFEYVKPGYDNPIINDVREMEGGALSFPTYIVIENDSLLHYFVGASDKGRFRERLTKASSDRLTGVKNCNYGGTPGGKGPYWVENSQMADDWVVPDGKSYIEGRRPKDSDAKGALRYTDVGGRPGETQDEDVYYYELCEKGDSGGGGSTGENCSKGDGHNHGSNRPDKCCKDDPEPTFEWEDYPDGWEVCKNERILVPAKTKGCPVGDGNCGRDDNLDYVLFFKNDSGDWIEYTTKGGSGRIDVPPWMKSGNSYKGFLIALCKDQKNSRDYNGEEACRGPGCLNGEKEFTLTVKDCGSTCKDEDCDQDNCYGCKGGDCKYLCKENEVCKNGKCVPKEPDDPCKDVVCPECHTCVNGKCEDLCKDGEVCQNGVCVPFDPVIPDDDYDGDCPVGSIQIFWDERASGGRYGVRYDTDKISDVELNSPNDVDNRKLKIRFRDNTCVPSCGYTELCSDKTADGGQVMAGTTTGCSADVEKGILVLEFSGSWAKDGESFTGNYYPQCINYECCQDCPDEVPPYEEGDNGDCDSRPEPNEIPGTNTRSKVYLYDRLNHTYVFCCPIKTDVTWLLPFDAIPPVFQRYITASAAVRAAVQMVDNPQLYQLLKDRENHLRMECMNYELEQGDLNYLGQPDYTTYVGYQPIQTLNR